MTDETPEVIERDPAAVLCGAMIIMTTVILIIAILIVNGITSAHYPGKGWF